MKIRKADIQDIPEIIKILDSARDFQRRLGFKQWKDGYPSVMNIESDINHGGAKVFLLDNTVVGYAFLAIGDTAYEALPDIWSFHGCYGVVHRLALSDGSRGRGLSSEVFRLIENEYFSKGVSIIRVDTGERNFIMQKIMSGNGYETKGLQVFTWGPRLVYEKQILSYR